MLSCYELLAISPYSWAIRAMSCGASFYTSLLESVYVRLFECVNVRVVRERCFTVKVRSLIVTYSSEFTTYFIVLEIIILVKVSSYLYLLEFVLFM